MNVATSDIRGSFKNCQNKALQKNANVSLNEIFKSAESYNLTLIARFENNELCPQLKTLKINPPYSYGNDMLFADLYILMKKRFSDFPLIQTDMKNVINGLNNDLRLHKSITENKYKHLLKFSKHPQDESLIMLYLVKTYSYFESIINGQGVYEFANEQTAERFKTNIGNILTVITSQNDIDLHKINIINAVIICYFVRGDKEPKTTLQWKNLLSAATSNEEDFGKVFNSYVNAYGLGALTTFLEQSSIKITTEESKKFVPIMTKSGMFGAKTYLKLFFNELIPYCCNLTYQSIHDGNIQTPYSILTHDIEHGIRSLPIMRDRNWFEYLRKCYTQIMSNAKFVNNKRLLVYLFVIIHEMGLRRNHINDFQSLIMQRYKIDEFFGRIEYDDSFVKMLQSVADEKIILQKGHEDQYVIAVLSALHEEFDKHFEICKECEKPTKPLSACLLF